MSHILAQNTGVKIYFMASSDSSKGMFSFSHCSLTEIPTSDTIPAPTTKQYPGLGHVGEPGGKPYPSQQHLGVP